MTRKDKLYVLAVVAFLVAVILFPGHVAGATLLLVLLSPFIFGFGR